MMTMFNIIDFACKAYENVQPCKQDIDWGKYNSNYATHPFAGNIAMYKLRLVYQYIQLQLMLSPFGQQQEKEQNLYDWLDVWVQHILAQRKLTYNKRNSFSIENRTGPF